MRKFNFYYFNLIVIHKLNEFYNFFYFILCVCNYKFSIITLFNKNKNEKINFKCYLKKKIKKKKLKKYAHENFF